MLFREYKKKSEESKKDSGKRGRKGWKTPDAVSTIPFPCDDVRHVHNIYAPDGHVIASE